MNQKTLLVLGGGALLLWLAMDTGKANASTGTVNTTTVQGLAVQLANNINAKGYDYDRALCRSFQSAAGMTGKDVDGIYGPMTKAALSKYTTAPTALFKGASSAARLVS